MAERSEFDRIIADYMEVSIPNVSDALDRLQLSGAPRGILPLWLGCRKIVGPAATMKLVPVGEGLTSPSPAMGSLEAVKAAHAGDILVIDHGGRMDVNSYGGIVGFTTQHFGLVGCVIDGVTRDVDEFKALGLPIYARGIIQQSIRNRCAFAGFGIEVELSGVKVRPGDFIVADENGVLVIPKERVIDVLKIAKEYKTIEERIVEAIRKGEDPVEAHERVNYDFLTQTSQ